MSYLWVINVIKILKINTKWMQLLVCPYISFLLYILIQNSIFDNYVIAVILYKENDYQTLLSP